MANPICAHQDCENRIQFLPGAGRQPKYCPEHRNPKSQSRNARKNLRTLETRKMADAFFNAEKQLELIGVACALRVIADPKAACALTGIQANAEEAKALAALARKTYKAAYENEPAFKGALIDFAITRLLASVATAPEQIAPKDRGHVAAAIGKLREQYGLDKVHQFSEINLTVASEDVKISFGGNEK